MTTLLSNAIFCCDPAQVSLLYAVECFRQGGGIRKMLDVEGGNQQDKVLGGAWSVLAAMAQSLVSQIHLSSPGTRIEQQENTVVVHTPHSAYEAERVIITIPPSTLGRVTFDPQLPPGRRGLIERMPMGSVIKMHVAYEHAFWRETELTGDVVSTDSPLSVVADQTMEGSAFGVLVVLVEGAHAIELSGMGREERHSRVVDQLVGFFGEEAKDPREIVEYDWTEDEWARGGYGCHMPPGVVTTFGREIRTPVNRLHWAGTETATENIGYFEGAIESGQRAAQEIITNRN